MQKLRRFWNQILIWASHLRRMGLTSDECLRQNVFPNKSFFRKESKLLIYYCKEGDINQVEKLLNKNRFLVYDFDSFHQTALHWAAKRNFPNIIKLLMNYGSFVDWKDLCNRTPLYLAAKLNHIKWVKALLAKEANPILQTYMGDSALSVAGPESLSYLKKAYLLLIANKFIEKSLRADIWKQEAIYYFETDNDEGIPFLM